MYDEQCFSDKLVLLAEGKLGLEASAYKTRGPGVLNLWRWGAAWVHSHSCMCYISFLWAEGFIGLHRGLCLKKYICI